MSGKDPLDEVIVLPGVLDPRVAGKIDNNLTLKIAPLRAERPFALLDCHDQSLRKSGCLLIETGRSLKMLQHAGPFIVQAARGNGRLPKDLPEGPVRDALQGFPPLRALMRIGEGRVETGSLTVLDDLQKTVLRGDMLVLRTPAGQVTLISLSKLRGYDCAYERMYAALTALSGPLSGVEAVFHDLYPDMEPYSSKPPVPLGHSEPAFQAANDIIRTFLGVAARNEAGVIADIDTEFLHDYRVSLRRIRSVLSLFKGVYSDAQTSALKAVFSGLMAPTGRLRDLDVYLLEKDIYFNLIPDSLHVGAQALFARFETERKAELTRLSRRFRSKIYQQQMAELAALFNTPEKLVQGIEAERGAYDYACRLIWKRYRKVCKLARAITDTTPDDDVHALRIHCKKLRYLMEFFAPLFDRRAFKAMIRPLKKLQDNLGLFNDYSVQQEALQTFIETRRGRVDAELCLAVGGLIAVLNQRQQLERARVVSNFAQFDSPKTRQLFRAQFHRAEE